MALISLELTIISVLLIGIIFSLIYPLMMLPVYFTLIRTMSLTFLSLSASINHFPILPRMHIDVTNALICSPTTRYLQISDAAANVCPEIGRCTMSKWRNRNFDPESKISRGLLVNFRIWIIFRCHKLSRRYYFILLYFSFLQFLLITSTHYRCLMMTDFYCPILVK